MSDNRPHYHLPYGQGPLLPSWLRVVYLWLLTTLGSSFVAWLGFRAFADATRGDLSSALGALAIGVVAGSIITWIIYGRKRQR